MLQARREGSTLIVVVEDHGAAIDASACAEPGTGIGLVNVRERLRRFYGDSAQLRTTRGEQGFTAEIRLPFEVIA